MKADKLILLVLLIIVFSCRIQLGEDDHWYGPGHMAIEDYTSYYYELPKTTQDLTLFIEYRLNSYPNSSSLYFGDAERLSYLLKKGRAELVYSVDSCMFYCKYRGQKEVGIFYSPDYQIRNLKRFHMEGGDLLFSTAVYNKDGMRINYDDEGWLLDTIKNKQAMLINDIYKTGEDGFDTIRILFKYENPNIGPLSEIMRNIFDLNRREGFMLSDGDNTTPQLRYVEYLDEVKEFLELYQESNPEVSHIIFPSLLLIEKGSQDHQALN